MKENSIEEDIKILEEMIENANIENMDMNNCFGGEHIEAIEHILSDYKRALKGNKQLKEYIAIAPNLDEMTATKYRNIQQDAYIQGRAEEQQKAEQIIYESYISKQIIKDKIEEYKNMLKTCNKAQDVDRIKAINERVLELQELLESEEYL